ncbi:uncharacterized protein TRIVIDRAFT_191851 [Trichoderma virens Gv29-8]|uniref:NmrA-like domain-containing protein n=1 Tax=Hypocrea virens (strain Gv29-8 / FGSC 10586) TaxID=413071 RepID=G9MUI6_HYPVG|nr:uncharacterized protein TRIVIDRAFT_191851 [Trichoderma virens Gv29-8]EHK21899.1 hypothetical protein TRIVIDRAFT_191851 [Trichoderma virens Gv29-8]
MTNKITTLVGITGKQGASIADVFLQEGGWHVRGVTAIQPSVELVKANLNDAASLKAAFAGSTVAFGVADFWGIVADPESQKRAQESGRPVNVLAYDLESATLETINRFVLLTLSPTTKLSKGKYTYSFHFNTKWEAVEYLKGKYSALEKKRFYLQVALYLENWKFSPLGGSLPGNPDAPVSQVIARHDTGSFVKALTQVEPGKRLPGASGFLSWNEYAALWGKVHCVQCSFPPLDRKVIENAIPSGVVEELADMYEYIGDFANHGDPSLRIGAPFWTIEEFIRQEGWSSIL